MNKTGIHAVAQHLQSQGRGRDTILAHIMPEEAAMLKRMGGSGTINPRTGLLEFDNPSQGPYDPPSSPTPSDRDSSPSNQDPSYPSNNGGNDYNYYTGGSDLGPYTGSGNTTYNPVTGGTDSSPIMGGAFGDNSSSNFLQSLGVPTLVANTMQSAGQSLLNFSDYAMGQYQQMTADPSGFFSSLTPTIDTSNIVSDTLQSAQDLASSALNFSGPQATNPLDWGAPIAGAISGAMNKYLPSTPPSPTDPVVIGPDGNQYLKDVNGNLYTRSISGGKNIAYPSTIEGAGVPTDALSGPSGPEPSSPTMVGGEAYDYTPAQYDLTPAAVSQAPVPSYLDPGGSGRMVSAAEVELFNEMQRARFEDQFGVPTQVIQQMQSFPGAEENRSPTSQITAPSFPGAEENRSPTDQFTAPQETSIDPYGFSGIQTLALPGTTFGPVTSFGVTPGEVIPGEAIPGQSVVATKPLIDAMRKWAPGTTEKMTDAEIKDLIAGGMPEGITFDPKTGNLINTTGLSVDEAVAQYGDFTTKWFNRDVPISQFVSQKYSPDVVQPAVSDFSTATGPTVTTEFSQNIGNALESEFENLTKPESISLGNTMSEPGSIYFSGISPGMYQGADMPVGISNLASSPIDPGYTDTGITAMRMASGLEGRPGTIDPKTGIGYGTEFYLNQLGELAPVAQTPGATILNRLMDKGYSPAFDIYGVGRTNLEQAMLQSDADKYLTAAPGRSMHNFALAMDVENLPSQGYLDLAQIAKEEGWGWGTWKDPAHVQMAPWGAGAVQTARRLGVEPFTGPATTASLFTPAEQKSLEANLPDVVTQVAKIRGLTSSETVQAAVKEGVLSDLLDYTLEDVNSEYIAPSDFRDALKALGYTDEQIDAASDLPDVSATPSSDDLLSDSQYNYQGGGDDKSGDYLNDYLKNLQKKEEKEKRPPRIYTTGIDLTPSVYVPEDVSSKTKSPAY